jgi:hypothetical protein
MHERKKCITRGKTQDSSRASPWIVIYNIAITLELKSLFQPFRYFSYKGTGVDTVISHALAITTEGGEAQSRGETENDMIDLSRTLIAQQQTDSH